MIDISKYRKAKGRKSLPYPSILSSIAPVPHDDTLLVPRPPENVEDMMEVSSGEWEGCDNEEMDENFEPRLSTRPHFPNQRELDELIWDSGLTMSGAELLAPRLSEWNLLVEDCKSTVYRECHEEFEVYFDISEDLCFCKDWFIYSYWNECSWIVLQKASKMFYYIMGINIHPCL
ncbi:uncharacterized protein LOC143019487 [Oratosquilla oratoria]|uniref:uncharacterized protein LOC143019487 n=1 Tax=Oratosquilla oratoria TaxID=337810 RepID=UPI003F75CEFD